ncbi:aldehyde dehydrogenase (NAD+) [Rhodoligotrophos appendicifer]|uniref:aldehyde dehydrogenase family protein n=1 Tax=Rhodoligotrophos appendicifer TaxID=987056 RepID=UPI00118560B2|nr:aldehyde dehydrogenase family protein [Rhodoligotrophos appendicifer]
MKHATKFYIDGAWVEPLSADRIPVIDPSTEEAFGEIAAGTAADVESAVAAASRAFPSFAATSKAERIRLLGRILECYEDRRREVAAALSQEMGAPIRFALEGQAQTGINHLKHMITTLEAYEFQHAKGTTLIVREPIGVVGLITPWNWPINQLVLKVAPALAAGCSMVLKPSEIAPFGAMIFADVMHEAGVPQGVFNLVNGDGPTVGHAIASHPDVAMVSITGSTRAGRAVAKAAADTVKRVAQELGGKSANILLEGVDPTSAVPRGVMNCFRNTGQSCTAPGRMLVPASMLAEVEAIARDTALQMKVGDPAQEETDLGPAVSKAQFDTIQHYISVGIEEGATLIAGGPGRPEGFNRGYYVRPTVFSNVTPDMVIARDEIFGPVLTIMPYRDLDEAVAIANDTVYGLSGNIQGDRETAVKVAARLRTGQVLINYPAYDGTAPFGGYGQSGNGREQGIFGLEEFLEMKAVVGALAG